MSTTNYRGQKVILPRSGTDEFWQQIHEHYAGQDSRKWKYLAMLSLRENCGWSLEQIGLVFDHPKGHVSRCLVAIKRDLRERFDVDWEDGFSDPDDLQLDAAPSRTPAVWDAKSTSPSA